VTDAEPEDLRAVPIVWVGADELPVITVNQFILQVDQGEIFLMAGTLTPPVILGEKLDDIRRQVDSIGFVPIRAVARFGLTRRRLTELIKLLERGVEMYDKGNQGEASK
jgi:hypothetical protein